MKTARANGGTAVVYVGLTETYMEGMPGIMWILDWDVLQVDASKIEPWFDMVCRI
jgi:hypothetical protein